MLYDVLLSVQAHAGGAGPPPATSSLSSSPAYLYALGKPQKSSFLNGSAEGGGGEKGLPLKFL